MDKESDSLIERMKKLPLWFYGYLFIFSAIFTNLLMIEAIDAMDMRRANERAAQIGSGIAGIILILTGIVLIILHFTRRKKNPPPPADSQP